MKQFNHPCIFCDKFTSSYGLRLQIQRHFSDKPYHCCICFRELVDASSRHRHEVNWNRQNACVEMGMWGTGDQPVEWGVYNGQNLVLQQSYHHRPSSYSSSIGTPIVQVGTSASTSSGCNAEGAVQQQLQASSFEQPKPRFSQNLIGNCGPTTHAIQARNFRAAPTVYHGHPTPLAYCAQPVPPTYRGQFMQPGYLGQSVSPAFVGQFVSPAYNGQSMPQAYYGQPATSGYNGQPMIPTYSGQPIISAYSGQPLTQFYSGQPLTQFYSGQPLTQFYSVQPSNQASNRQPTPQAFSRRSTTQAFSRQPAPKSFNRQPTHQAYRGYSKTQALSGQPTVDLRGQSTTSAAFSGQPTPQAFSGQPTPQAFSGQPTPQAFSGQPTPQAFNRQSTPQAFNRQPTPQAFNGQSIIPAYVGQPITPAFYTGQPIAPAQQGPRPRLRVFPMRYVNITSRPVSFLLQVVGLPHDFIVTPSMIEVKVQTPSRIAIPCVVGSLAIVRSRGTHVFQGFFQAALETGWYQLQARLILPLAASGGRFEVIRNEINIKVTRNYPKDGGLVQVPFGTSGGPGFVRAGALTYNKVITRMHCRDTGINFLEPTNHRALFELRGDSSFNRSTSTAQNMIQRRVVVCDQDNNWLCRLCMDEQHLLPRSKPCYKYEDDPLTSMHESDYLEGETLRKERGN